jgi:signal transduction histidine kinase
LTTPQQSPPRQTVDDVLQILANPDDRDFAEVVELAASICGGDAAGIGVRRGEEYHVPITFGIAPQVFPAEDTFCQLTMRTEEVLAVEDAWADPEFGSHAHQGGPFGAARFYASAPVRAPNGVMVGRLCVIGDQPKHLTSMQLRALETLALSVSKLIELRFVRSAHPGLDWLLSHDATTVLKQLTAELSHDLRVPLAAVVASLELLEDHLGDVEDPMTAILLQRSTSSAGRMSRMLEHHLAAATSPAGATPGETDLNLVARQLVADCGSVLQSMRATVEVEHLPVVRADPDEMYRVLQNLVTNSIKFGRPNVPVRVRITARPVPEGWRIAVVDNGVGIPADRRADVFSLFSRAHQGVDGHGIGLATVARIVAANGGRCGADEPLDGGTEIWFSLPEG